MGREEVSRDSLRGRGIKWTDKMELDCEACGGTVIVKGSPKTVGFGLTVAHPDPTVWIAFEDDDCYCRDCGAVGVVMVDDSECYAGGTEDATRFVREEDLKLEITDRLAELQRLDLSDPRKALEELATVAAVAVRAMQALERLDRAVRDSYAREAKAAWDEHAHKPRAVEDQQSQQDRRQAAIDDARDEARRLLAEVLL
jgi:hypothetical protein